MFFSFCEWQACKKNQVLITQKKIRFVAQMNRCLIVGWYHLLTVRRGALWTAGSHVALRGRGFRVLSRTAKAGGGSFGSSDNNYLWEKYQRSIPQRSHTRKSDLFIINKDWRLSGENNRYTGHYFIYYGKVWLWIKKNRLSNLIHPHFLLRISPFLWTTVILTGLPPQAKHNTTKPFMELGVRIQVHKYYQVRSTIQT